MRRVEPVRAQIAKQRALFFTAEIGFARERPDAGEPARAGRVLSRAAVWARGAERRLLRSAEAAAGDTWT